MIERIGIVLILHRVFDRDNMPVRRAIHMIDQCRERRGFPAACWADEEHEPRLFIGERGLRMGDGSPSRDPTWECVRASKRMAKRMRPNERNA